MKKTRLAVYKFTSCDGCQLAFLNAGLALLELAEQVEFLHFAEAGIVNPDASVDITFVEGSITTPEEVKRIQTIRNQTTFLITIGACATAGGIQALRNAANEKAWMASIYASPEWIETLDTSTAIANHVKVDWELWGCPVNGQQVLSTIRSLLSGATPAIARDAVCLECKRLGHVCVMVAKQEPCMGPVTQTGCGALCPGMNRGCYACFGPAECTNPASLATQFEKMGSSRAAIVRQFLHINNQAPVFKKAYDAFKGVKIVKK